MKLQDVKNLCENICWNGGFSIEISPLSQTMNMSCPTIRLLENSDEPGQFDVDTGQEDENGDIILHPFETYNWPEWALVEELLITVEAI